MNRMKYRMKYRGVTLMFIGLGGFILPIFGIQFRVLNPSDQGPTGKLVVAGIGLVLFVIGSKKDHAASDPQPPTKAASTGLKPLQTCPKCYRALVANKKFCTACGTPVS